MLTESIKNFKHVIWDWNGTLLNDVDIAVDAMNSMLERRNLPFLNIERYRNIFTFPVKDYYTQLGFDFSAEPFEKLAAEYISTYNSYSYRFRLYDGVEEILSRIGRLGITQSILSASREPELIEAVRMMNIKDYFIRIAGLNNHYAASKVARGKDLLIDLGLKPDEALLIGDTVHDYEVAAELGCSCLLICSGHQSFRRIQNCNTGIVDTISDVVDFIKVEAIA